MHFDRVRPVTLLVAFAMAPAVLARQSSSGLPESPWVVSTGQASAPFGYALSGAGDVNGDGFDDVVLGASFYDGPRQNTGKLFLYFGASAGPSTVPDWTEDGTNNYELLGGSVALAGDVNADGFGDVLVTRSDHGDSQATLYLGNPQGLTSPPVWSTNLMRTTLGGAGDVNGDGYDDVAVSNIFYESGQSHSDEGAVFLFFGSPSGPSPTPDWVGESNSAQAWFGYSFSIAGDVNGDGFDDVLVSAPHFGGHSGQGFGAVYLFLGSPNGPSIKPDWVYVGDALNTAFGDSLSSSGDVNGDGFDDVVVGQWAYSTCMRGAGQVHVFHGSATGLSADPDRSLVGGQGRAGFGYEVAVVGDLDGEGFDDVLITSRDYRHGQPAEGLVSLHLGSAGGLSTDAFWTAESDHTLSDWGRHLGRPGDANGDGYDDLLIGAGKIPGGGGVLGLVYLYFGSPYLDCNGNGTDDALDVTSGTSPDCNGNGVPDECDVSRRSLPDVDRNGVPDVCESVGAEYCVSTCNSYAPDGARLFAVGSRRITDDDLTLVALGSVPEQVGLFYFGSNQVQVPFGDGFRCVSGQISRLYPVLLTDDYGRASLALDFTQSPADRIAPGSTWQFQWWHRDSALFGGSGFNLSHGLGLTFE